ncbi:MAG: DUF3465 domain-containing protein [Xanthomonadaceae bacterium]|nr:DUF3465 domain-containing protein [Xanthomonadaceae bacterium]
MVILVCLEKIACRGDTVHGFSKVLPGLLVFASLAGCGGDSISNERLLDAFEDGRTSIWVSGQAPVSQILGDEGIGGPHQRFVLRLNEGVTIIVRHSLQASERVPVERGDSVRFHGRYDWEASGGIISLTHSDPEQPGGGGWVEHKGVRYD